MKKLSDRWMYYSGMLAMMCPSVNVDDLKHIQDLIDEEEQGLLLRLPIKVGDTFWELNNCLLEPCIYPRIAHSLQHVAYCMDRLGKITFRTKADAEAALEKMEGEEHE